MSMRMRDQEIELPSEVTDTPWIWPESSGREYNPATTGKWLIFRSRKSIDDTWLKVKEAHEKGLLGPEAKVSTCYDSPFKPYKNSHVICVYTDDCEDKDDVIRVMTELENIGITDEKLRYKSDKATKEGKYGSSGVLYRKEDLKSH